MVEEMVVMYVRTVRGSVECYRRPVCVSMVELDLHARTPMSCLLYRLEYVGTRDDSTRRYRGIGQALRAGDQVRGHVEPCGCKGSTQPTEAGDDFIEDQQDVVPRADVTYTLQVSLRWWQDAGAARYRFDDL